MSISSRLEQVPRTARGSLTPHFSDVNCMNGLFTIENNTFSTLQTNFMSFETKAHFGKVKYDRFISQILC